MPDFWLDSNIYIATGYRSSEFWRLLDIFVPAGRISSPAEVYDELNRKLRRSDSRRTWIRERRNSHFTAANESVQAQFSRVSDYVRGRYTSLQSDEFISGADPWLISHALASGGSIVTNETPSQEPNPNRNTGLIDTKVKIPNVADHFGVETISLPTMLGALGVNDL